MHTANITSKLTLEALAKGANEVISKTRGLSELTQIIDRYLDKQDS